MSDSIEKIQRVIAELEVSIPGFSRSKEVDYSDVDDDIDLQTWMMEAIFDESNSVYVEWKEFDSWGFDGLCELAVLRQRGISLSIDELYDKDDMLIDVDTDPYNLYVSHLNQQLQQHDLQLVEIGAHANPTFVCLPLDEVVISRLSTVLKTIGIPMIVPGLGSI